MKLTVDAVMALHPCYDYSRERVEALLDRPLGTESQVVDLLLELPADDACWVLSRALSVPNRVVWAKACAARARRYAESADAKASDADYAARAAQCADAAEYAANAEYAAQYAANAAQYADAEHRLAVEHGVRLMGAK